MKLFLQTLEVSNNTYLQMLPQHPLAWLYKNANLKKSHSRNNLSDISRSLIKPETAQGLSEITQILVT